MKKAEADCFSFFRATKINGNCDDYSPMKKKMKKTKKSSPDFIQLT